MAKVGIAIASIGALLGAGALYLTLQLVGKVGAASSGDEPPISVKHGSIKLDLLASKSNQVWKPNGGKWTIEDGTGNGQEFKHNSNKYDVLIGTSNTAACSSGTFVQARSVTVNYRSGDSVTIALDTQKKTSVSVKDPAFNTNQKDKELEFERGSGNYITTIVNDDTGTTVCAFTVKTDVVIGLLDSY
jgi:hypothetical protein